MRGVEGVLLVALGALLDDDLAVILDQPVVKGHGTVDKMCIRDRVKRAWMAMEIALAASATSWRHRNCAPSTRRVSGSQVRVAVTGVVVSMKSGR